MSTDEYNYYTSVTTVARLDPPSAFGLPEQFTEWRPVQEDALDFIWGSTKRIKAICVPTGGGKSVLAIGDALKSKKPTCYVTDSRALQDQVLQTFASCGIADLRGRSNYQCAMRDEYTCEDGYAARCPHKGKMSCAASAAEMRAAASWLVTTNYDKWIHSRRFGQGLAHIQRVIFDEGHAGFDALSRAMQVFLGSREVESVLGVDFPEHHDAHFFETWKTWAQVARLEAERQMLDARARIVNGGHVPYAWVKHYTHLRNLSRRLAILSTANVKNWIVEEQSKGYQFDPVQPGRYVESALLLNVPDILIMSATLRPKTLHMLGIGNAAFDFKEFPSDFDPKRCPVYYVPTLRVDARNHDLSMLWIRLDQIASPRQDRNGLVHTVSFTRRDEAVSRSRFAHKMFINERGEPATAMVEEFKRNYPGAILVSPSVGTGFDFSGKSAEWQLICKVPFPPPSKVMKARTEVDKEYPYMLAMQKLVQMVGRPMRSKDDQAESFICDDHFKWFLPRYRHLAPNSFNAVVREVTILPQPPPRLG